MLPVNSEEAKRSIICLMLPVNSEEAKRSIICRFAGWSDREECVERRGRKWRVQNGQSSQTYPRPWGPNALTHCENAEWWGETRGSRLEWCRDSWWLPAVDSAHASPFFSIALIYFLLSLLTLHSCWQISGCVVCQLVVFFRSHCCALLFFFVFVCVIVVTCFLQVKLLMSYTWDRSPIPPNSWLRAHSRRARAGGEDEECLSDLILGMTISRMSWTHVTSNFFETDSVYRMIPPSEGMPSVSVVNKSVYKLIAAT